MSVGVRSVTSGTLEGGVRRGSSVVKNYIIILSIRANTIETVMGLEESGSKDNELNRCFGCTANVTSRPNSMFGSTSLVALLRSKLIDLSAGVPAGKNGVSSVAGVPMSGCVLSCRGRGGRCEVSILRKFGESSACIFEELIGSRCKSEPRRFVNELRRCGFNGS